MVLVVACGKDPLPPEERAQWHVIGWEREGAGLWGAPARRYSHVGDGEIHSSTAPVPECTLVLLSVGGGGGAEREWAQATTVRATSMEMVTGILIVGGSTPGHPASPVCVLLCNRSFPSLRGGREMK